MPFHYLRSLLSNARPTSWVILPIPGGIVPVRKFPYSATIFRFVKVHSSDGIDPVRPVSPDVPSEAEIIHTRIASMPLEKCKFLAMITLIDAPKFKLVNFVNAVRKDGIVPLRFLLYAKEHGQSVA